MQIMLLSPMGKTELGVLSQTEIDREGNTHKVSPLTSNL